MLFAGITFAVVVGGVCQPYMEIVYFRMEHGISRYLFYKRSNDIWVGIAQVRVNWNSLKKSSFSVHKGCHVFLFFGKSRVRRNPSQSILSQYGTSPAVPYPMVFQASFLQFPVNNRGDFSCLFQRKCFRSLERIVFMAVPQI